MHVRLILASVVGHSINGPMFAIPTRYGIQILYLVLHTLNRQAELIATRDAAIGVLWWLPGTSRVVFMHVWGQKWTLVKHVHPEAGASTQQRVQVPVPAAAVYVDYALQLAQYVPCLALRSLINQTPHCYANKPGLLQGCRLHPALASNRPYKKCTLQYKSPCSLYAMCRMHLQLGWQHYSEHCASSRNAHHTTSWTNLQISTSACSPALPHP